MSRGIIVLDAGHGQFGNPYPDIEGAYEGTRNFVLACFLKKTLESKGFEVLLTRENIEDNPSLEDRGRLAGERGALLFISLHSNAPGGATTPEAYKSVCGCEVYYSMSDEAFNAPLALALCETISTCIDTPNRGAKTRTYPDQPGVDFYGVLRNSVTYGCKHAFIIEHGFHTNPHDAAFLNDDGCMARLAEAEACVIDGWFE